jgi:glycosyltransferase involved in cell wall biosynthesis
MPNALSVLALSEEYPPFGWGGVTPFAVNLLHGLRARGVEVVLLTPGAEAAREVAADGLVVHRVAAAPFAAWTSTAAARIAAQARLARRARELCRGWRPHVVLPIDGLTFAPARTAAQSAGALVVTPVHQIYADLVPFGGGMGELVGIESCYLRESDALLAAEPWFVGRVRKHLMETVGDRHPPLFPLTFGVGCQEGDLKGLPFALPTTTHRRVAFLGRLVPEKGLSRLLRAIAVIDRTTPEVCLVVAGSGPLRAAAEAEVADLNLFDRVHFLGHVPWPQCGEVFRWAELVVVPSENEPMGYVPLEALMAGTLPLVAATGGLRDLAALVPWECTFPTAADDPDCTALARRICDALALPYERRRSIVAVGRRICAARHDPCVMADQFVAACKEVLRSRAGCG